MTVLIVEDDPPKAQKIKEVVEEALLNQESMIITAGSNAECLAHLAELSALNLLVLDMNLPIRAGEFAKEDSGLKLLKEIIRRGEFPKPDSIIGMTQFEHIHTKARTTFDQEGWAIVKYDPKTNGWEETIRNKINWLLNKKTLAVKPDKIKILFISSSPLDQSPLNVGTEQRLIEEALALSSKRDIVELSIKHGAKLDTLTRELMQFSPDFLHFTGHGHNTGIIMEQDNGRMVLIPNTAIEKLFKLFKDKMRCVVLSSCYSNEQARTISEQHIHVVGMNDRIGVKAATEFSKGFYQAIGEGKNIEEAFAFGMVHLSSFDELQQEVPELWLNGEKIK